MAKCPLGPKKLKEISAILGMPVLSAYVRGGWKHSSVEAWTDKHTAFLVNRYDKTYEPYIVNNEFIKTDESL